MNNSVPPQQPTSAAPAPSNASSSDLVVPQQDQPFARFVHAPTAARALQQRRMQHDPIAQLSGGASFAASATPVDSSAALVWVFDPSHRWVHNPSELHSLLSALLRGHSAPWTILMYSSRAKALQHTYNLNRAPLRPSDRRANLPPALYCNNNAAGSAPLVVHALISTYAVNECWSHLAQPLGLPLIYFGSDPRQLAEVYAIGSSSLSSANRLDELFSVAERIRSKDQKHGAIGALLGVGRTGNSARNYPYPSLLLGAAADSGSSRIYGGRFYREAEERWAVEEQAKAEGDEVLSAAVTAMDRADTRNGPVLSDPLESRPNSPEYLARVTKQVFERVADRERTEAAEKQKAEQEAKQKEIAAHNLPPSAAQALRSGMRVGLADAAPMLSARPGHSATAVAASSSATAATPAASGQTASLNPQRLLSPSASFRQLSVEVPSAAAALSSSTRIQVIDEIGRARPSSASSPANKRSNVQFSSSTRTPKSGRSSGPSTAASSALLSPNRTVRNPFGTASGLPSPAQVAEALAQQVEIGAPLHRPASALASPFGPQTPLHLTEESMEDSRVIQDIERLSAKLHSYDLPSPSKPQAKGTRSSGLPADTMPERFAAFAAQVNSSHILDAPTRAALLADHAAQLAALPRRNLYDLERARLGAIESKAKHRSEWMRNAAATQFEEEALKSTRQLMENDSKVASIMQLSDAERKYRQDLLAIDRISLAEIHAAQKKSKVEAFNQAQSTAAQKALAKIPDAPKLTNLQAIFLSPTSRAKQKADAEAERKCKEEQRKGWTPPPTGPTNRPLRRGVSLTLDVPTPAPTVTAPATPLSPVAALASGAFTRPSASAIESALRRDFAVQDEQRRASERKQLELESVIYSKAKQAKINEWHAMEKLHMHEVAHQQAQRNAAQERDQLRQMVKQAFGDQEDELDAAARAKKIAASFGLSANQIAEEELQSRSRLKREAIFASLVPTLASDQARQDQEAMQVRMDLARAELIARADERLIREMEDNSALQEIRSKRKSEWAKNHPPLPTHSMSLATRRVERRNPHEWHSELMEA